MRGAGRPVECGYFVSFYELICASACEQLDAFLDDHAISGRKIESRRNGTQNNCRFFFFAESEVIGVAGGEAGVAGAGIVGASDAGPEFLVAEVVGPGVILLESRSSFQPQ